MPITQSGNKKMVCLSRDKPGGTGNTFPLNTILSYYRSRGDIEIA